MIEESDWAEAALALADAQYGGLTKARAEELGYYECICSTPLVIADGGVPAHGDVVAGHCQVCFRTTGQRRSRQRLVDNARKFCASCGWVDKAHFKTRHAQKHASGDEGTGTPRRVDWEQSLVYRAVRRPRPRMELPAPTPIGRRDLPVEPAAVFWASESVELTVLLSDVPLAVLTAIVESQPRLEIMSCLDDAAARPGFVASRFHLLFQHASECCLRFYGFNAEFGFFNGDAPRTDVPANVRLVSSALTMDAAPGLLLEGHILFYTHPRCPADHVRLQCRELSQALIDHHHRAVEQV